MRVRHLQQIIGFALNRSLIASNYLTKIPNRYDANRADIFWTAEEIEAFELLAPKHVGRILRAAAETGLRRGELYRLSQFNVETAANGKRIQVKTNKRKRLVSIPVTEKMNKLIEATPKKQSIFIVGKKGNPYTHPNYLGDAVSSARDAILEAFAERGQPAPFRAGLRLYDARGTAATRLLRAGATIPEIATAMGWSIKKATETIDSYVRLHPDMTDGLGAKIERLEKADKL